MLARAVDADGFFNFFDGRTDHTQLLPKNRELGNEQSI
jgi:hypothetical protein